MLSLPFYTEIRTISNRILQLLDDQSHTCYAFTWQFCVTALLLCAQYFGSTDILLPVPCCLTVATF